MKKSIRLLSVLFILALLFVSVVSCGTEPEKQTEKATEKITDEQTQATEVQTEDLNRYTKDTPNAIDLSEYTIIRAEDADSDVVKICTQFKTYLKSYCGVKVLSANDSDEPDGKEIVIGKTNRPASTALVEKEKDFTVQLIDGNIYITSGVNQSLAVAVEWFKRNCLQEGNRYAVIAEGISYRYDYQLSEVKVGDATIEQTAITYMAKDNIAIVDTAYRLAYEILEKYGVLVSVSTYNPLATTPQILVASTSIAKNALPAGLVVSDGNYVNAANGNTIYLVAGTAIGVEQAVQQFIDNIRTYEKKNEKNGSVDLLTLCKNDNVPYSVTTNTMEIAENASYRVMSYNVERQELNTRIRYDEFMKEIKYANPDVIGFQEYCDQFTANLTSKLVANGYTVLGNELTTDSSQNMTPIAFKTDRFELVKSGWVRMNNTYNPSDGKNYKGHQITWAVLKDKTTNEVFAVTSTHFFHLSDRTKANPVREENSAELLALVQKIATDYSCGVISVGDYNSYPTDAAYKKLESSEFFEDSRNVAKLEAYSQGTTHTEGLVNIKDAQYAIDFAFVSSPIDVYVTRLGINEITAMISDHYPVIVDFAVKS